MDKFFAGQATNNDIDRIDARVKVTGKASYAAEYDLPNLCHGALVAATITKGSIAAIDTVAARRAPGVVAVLTHVNRPRVPGWEQPKKGEGRVEGREFRPFFDNKIHFDRQPVALVIADTFERAIHAATLVKVRYAKEQAQTAFEKNVSKAIPAKREKDYRRGDAAALQSAPVQLEAHYTTPLQVHHPMETHAAVVHWPAPDKVLVYNKTQATKLAQQEIAQAFNLPEDAVTVHSPFVGGAFGSSSRVWPEEMAAILGAKLTGRPVKVMLRRDHAFNMVGYRPASIQNITIGAKEDGTLVGIRHQSIGTTSQYEQFAERIADPTKVLYNCDNVAATYRLVQLDMSTPCWTRGPGETSGSFALESAMDELAYKLQMDPMALRLKNFAPKDLEKRKPWSSNYLKECYEKGAAAFGWEKRNSKPRSTKEGDWLVGVGMAAGVYHSRRSPATARATLRSDGSLLVQTSVADTGPGSATIFTQIAADAMGLPASKVEFQWGRSTLPPAPGQFGSQTTSSTGSGVHDAVKALQQKLKVLLRQKEGSPFAAAKSGDMLFENGFVRIKDGNTSLSYTDALKTLGEQEVQVTHESKPPPEIEEGYSGQSFCANFVEVKVHEQLGTVRLSRVVSAVDAGAIINQKTAASQVYGSVVWGIGIALLEEGIIDHRYGRYINNDLANYHLPVAADIPPIEVHFIDKPDTIIDPMGAKGLGEIGLIGFTAAVANAVYHATGKRIRDLPITPEKVLG